MPSSPRLRWMVIGPFLVVVAMMVVLGIASSEILSAVRAYVGGESQWSKGQKDASFHLAKFATSHAADEFQRYRAAIAVPLGDSLARIELERPHSDLAAVRKGFLAGGNHPDDIASMIWLFRNFRHVSFMAQAIDIWAEADQEIAALDVLAQQIRQRVAGGHVDAAQTAKWLSQLTDFNDRLTLLEQRFSGKLSEASRIVSGLLLGATVLLGAALAAAATTLSLRPLRRQERAESALRESEARLQRALEASGLALWDLDLASGKIYLSESWSQRLGGPHEVTHTTLAELMSLVPENERPSLMAKLLQAVKDPQATYRVEHLVRRNDGEWIWNLSEGHVVERDSNGRALRMVGTNRDTTERKQAETARRALEAQLRQSQKMEAVGTLAGGIAHDFNNILGAILGNIALARESLPRDDAARTNLEQINKAALRARALVQQILAFSRRQPQELKNRPLRPLVLEAMALMRSTLPAGVALDADMVEAPVHALADATQMQQVLVNLCTNAWHALQGKAGRIVVGLESVQLDDDAAMTIGGLRSGWHAHVWVSDDGCGMNMTTLSRIFEPFFTTKPVGQGTGLGLPVVHGIVAAHHGAITAQSRLGQGSTFHMYFPQLEPSDGAEAPSDWGALEPLQDHGQGEHVLYIDDDEVMVLLVDQLLRRLGYRVTCHADPLLAIAALRAQPQAFDLVVSDYNMPQCSGVDVARAAAQLRPELPVVISSGYITEELRAEARRAGVRSLMQKEKTLEDLGALVHSVLRPG